MNVVIAFAVPLASLLLGVLVGWLLSRPSTRRAPSRPERGTTYQGRLHTPVTRRPR